ncbi:MAG: hypothetical protein Q7S23_05120, partial [bacterium]|nr:hypothetical protein [bacterium]
MLVRHVTNRRRFSVAGARFFAPVLLLAVGALTWMLSASVLPARAVAGVPKILHHQGRLLNASGSLLGSTSGTDYCFRFSIFDDATVGGAENQLWPVSTPKTMTVSVKEGVFNVGIGDTSANGDTLSLNFQDYNEVYLNVEVAAQVSSSCSGVSFQNLEPRQRITSSGYAINSDTVDGLHATSTATAGQLLALDSTLSLNLATGGVSTTRATTTSLILSADGADLTGLNDVYVSGGSLYFNSLNLSSVIFSPGSWQAFSANVLTPTNTAAGLIVNASSTFRSLTIDGNATTTGRLVIGTTQPSGLFGTGDLFIGNSATITASLGLPAFVNCSALETNAAGALSCGTDDVGGVGSGLGQNGAWQVTFGSTALAPTNTALGFFVNASSTVAGGFRVDGNATGTGRLYLGTAQPTGNFGNGDLFIQNGATSTALAVTGLATCTAVEANGLGTLICGTDQNTLGQNGAWQQFSANVLAPTNTSAGIIVNASSTFGTSLRIDGSTTSTGRFVIGTTQPSGNVGAGDLFVGGDATTTGSLAIGTSSASDDDYLYFDGTGFEALWW